MSKMSKNKGYRGERDLVKALEIYGINARRQPLSGSATPDNPGDVVIPQWFGNQAVEVKYREDLSSRLWAWLDPAPALFLRRRHKRWIMVMDLQKLIDWVEELTPQKSLNIEPTEKECTWQPSKHWEDPYFTTSCDAAFEFTLDGPEQSAFKYCPYCGLTLRRKNYEEISECPPK